ncbi:MAG: winged helix-turn-helix domain-containing protein [Pyrinomonadaceae bacterium MAG19_C2-C3]|nr:winged helix-turn-helix domain-containing protein [Pyrinomonadaceae bacterium MAG19_C2-C3]
MDMQRRRFYDFGAFRLDTQNHFLVRDGGETVSLTPKEFEVLLVLIEHAGDVVAKDALLDAVWKDTFINEETLTRNVSWLRKKLGGEKFIETVPKFGYRFAAQVTARDAPDLIIEEQTVQHIRVEETISLSEPPAVAGGLLRDEGRGQRDEKNIAKDGFVHPSSLILHPSSYPPATAGGSDKKLWLALTFGVVAIAAIAFTVYQNFFRQSAPRTIFAAKIVPLTGAAGHEDTPAFSPDGRQIAFSWNGGDEVRNFDIYVKLVGAGEPVRLTKHETNDLNPTFSPDGLHLAFVRTFATHSELMLIPALGGAERKICDLRPTLSGVSFSPDGKTLAVDNGDTSGEQTGIFLVTVETGEKRRLTAPPEYAADDKPKFSPDGKSIVFVRSFGSIVQELFVVSSAGGDARQLTFDKTEITGAAWNADGTKIVFASRRGKGSETKLWQMAATGGGEPELIATGGKNPANPTVAPDGRTIAFVESSQDMNIWRLQRDEGGGMRDEKNTVKTGSIHPSSLRPHPFIKSSRNDNSPHFSPDGTRVVFASDRTTNYDIWIADADGSNARQLTDLEDAPTGSPRFSPDNCFVAFDAQVSGNGDIFVVPADGGAIRRLTESDSFDFMPSWSADGNSIYFASNRGGDEQIWKMPAAGGDAIQITKQGGRESFESPDGAELYFSKAEGATGLWRVPSDGGEENAVPELAEAGYWRAWTITREGIYFVARTAATPYKIKFYDFKIRQLKEIAQTEKPPVWVFSGLSVSADGKTILYAQNDQNASSIMLAELGK